MNNQNIWQNNILSALENSNFNTSDLIKFQSLDDSGKRFMEEIAFQKNIFDFLNNLELVNTDICPITNEIIYEEYKYSIFGRTIYLSKNGSEICENGRRIESNSRGVNYDALKKKKNEIKQQSKVFTFIILIISLIISYFVTKPNSFLSIILFFLTFLLVLGILNYIAINILSSLFYKSKK